jgi:hypothetical protein
MAKGLPLFVHPLKQKFLYGYSERVTGKEWKEQGGRDWDGAETQPHFSRIGPLVC